MKECFFCGQRLVGAVRRYWKGRLVKGGPFIPVQTWWGNPIHDGEELERHHRWNALVRLETTSRAVLDLGDGDTPVRIDGILVMNLTPIQEVEYRYMVEHARWATAHDPDSPDASPTTPISWLRTRPAI